MLEFSAPRTEPHDQRSDRYLPKTLWHGLGAPLEHILRYTVLTLLEVPGSTLLDIPNLLLDTEYRNGLLTNVDNFSALLLGARVCRLFR